MKVFLSLYMLVFCGCAAPRVPSFPVSAVPSPHSASFVLWSQSSPF